MKRVTVNLPDNIGQILEQKSASEKRSASSYLALLVENDLRATGHLSASAPDAKLAEFIAKLTAAHAASPRVIPRLEATLRRSLRQKKDAA